MPHLNEGPGEHDSTAGAFILRIDGTKPRIILHRHRKLGKFFHFGGHVEKTQTPWRAVTDEILQESGYQLNQLTLFQPPGKWLEKLPGTIAHPYPIVLNTHRYKPGIDHFHTEIGYAFATDQPPTEAIGKDESDEIIELTREELAALPEDEILPSVRTIALFVFDEILPKWRRLPAADWPQPVL